MMKHKGQVLALFVVVLPFLLTLIFFTIELGLTYNYKKKMINVSKQVISNYLDNESIDEVYEIIDYNLTNVTKSITTNDNYIKIELEYYYKTLVSGFINDDGYYIKTTYVGYIENHQKIIKEE
ncbi:MAG: pilus assembly protein [Bacilli bacterium]|nr:pilus assembly protein [Bacilli bacterium]